MIRRALAVFALAFALAHAPFVAPSLEDIDSVNFALGVRDFDVAEHRPHPPGYPVYIGIGKAAVAVRHLLGDGESPARAEAQALSVISMLGGITAIFLIYGTYRELSGGSGADGRALAAAALAASSPLYWYLAVRPMSDLPGLAAAAAALWCFARAWTAQRSSRGERRLTAEQLQRSGSMIVLGALLAGLAIGFRSQNAMITMPFLAAVLLDRTGRGVAGALIGAAVAFSVGVLVWAVPLVLASGGVNGYLAALGTQAGEDFAGVEMLYLNPGNARLAAFATLRTLVYPWDSLPLGGIIIALAVVGACALMLRQRRTLVALAAIAVPYLAFHLLFHDTTFVRYALPLVPVVAYLCVVGLEWIVPRAALPVVGGLALWAVSIAAPTVAAYSAEPGATARAVAEMRAAAAVQPPGALAMHQTFRRPLQAADVNIARALDAPPRREWLELAEYWREGHQEVVWFLADPVRTDLALVDPRSRTDRTRFRPAWHSLSELGGMRPKAVDWYRLPLPGWFAETGWSLTPETAGIARLMGRGPAHAPITAWVRRRPEAVDVLIGGRHLGSPGDPPADFVMAVDGRDVAQWQAAPGFFLQQVRLPSGTFDGEGYAALTLRSSGPAGQRVETAVEQFDLQSVGTLMWGYDEGWHEAEYNPSIGVWRWTSAAATLRIINASSPVVLTLEAEQPRRYFDEAPTVRLVAGDQIVAETDFATGTWRVVVPPEVLARADGRLTIETNRTFVPADTSDVRDLRRLGLRVLSVDVAYEH